MNTNRPMSYKVTALLLTLSLFIIAACQKAPNSGATNEQPSPTQVLSTEEQNNGNTTTQEGEKDLRTEIAENLKGYKIAFASSSKDGNSNDIWMANVDGSGEKQLTTGKGIDMYPEWSGDGQFIYYTGNKHGGTLEIYRVNTTGDPQPQQLSLFGKEVRSLSVSADNKMITMGIMSDSVPFGADLKAYSADLYIIDMAKVEKILAEGRLLNLGDLTVLASEPKAQHIWHEQPAFQKSPDGIPYIAYARTENYDDDAIMKDTIWLIKADGSENKLLLDQASMPQWAFDDTHIVTHGFQVMNLKTKEVKSLKIDGRSEDAGSASISPDGKYVIFETSDQSRKAGLARVVFDGEKTPNPILLFSERGAYEPRWSPVPVAD